MSLRLFAITAAAGAFALATCSEAATPAIRTESGVVIIESVDVKMVLADSDAHGAATRTFSLREVFASIANLEGELATLKNKTDKVCVSVP